MNITGVMDWHLIRSFVAVLDAGSLLGAAKLLGSNQPTVGRQIAALERQLGLDLFERTGRGLVPTSAALRVADAARQMAQAATEFTHAASNRLDEAAGTVCISASTPVAYALLPPLLAQMAADLPRIGVEVVATNELSNLLQREADIALRMVQPEQGSTVARRVGEVRLGAFAHPSYLAKRPAPSDVRELAQHRFVADRRGEIARGFAAMGLQLKPEQVAFASDDLLAQWGAIRAGLGIGFVSLPTAHTDPAVVQLLPQLPIGCFPMWLVAHREVRSVRRIKAVYDWLGDALSHSLSHQ